MAAITAVAAGVSMATTAATTGASFIQASKQKKLQASYGEQTESTRPQSKFIHDILYK